MEHWKLSSHFVICDKCKSNFRTLTTLKRHLKHCNNPPVEMMSETILQEISVVSKKIKLEIPEIKEKQVLCLTIAEVPTKFETNEDNKPRKRQKVESFICSYCNYKTSYRHNFERHVKSHAITKTNKCPYCSFSSTGKNIIKTHVSSYHGDKVQMSPSQKSKSTDESDDMLVDSSLDLTGLSLSSDVNQSLNETNENVVSICEVEPLKVDKDAEDAEDAKPKKENIPSVESPESIGSRKVSKNGVTRTSTPTQNTRTINQTKPKPNLITKYICEDCPYKGNGLEHFRNHRKHHSILGREKNKYRCPHCSFAASKASVAENHIKFHRDIYIPEDISQVATVTCRCHFAEKTGLRDLACFQMIKCPCCTVRNPSVKFLRSHICEHIPLTLASRFEIFNPKFDEADEYLRFKCVKVGQQLEPIDCRVDCREEVPENVSDIYFHGLGLTRR